jgi:MSHA pilin protein MshC
MAELVVIIVIMGVLAAVIVPKLTNGSDAEAATFADRILATLRVAQKAAVAKRRLVCVQTAPMAFLLRMAKLNPAPAGACTFALDGQSDSDSATTDTSVAATSSNSLIGTQLYFQPNGQITTDPAGQNPAAGNIVVSARGTQVRTITIEGATGYVDFGP